jgi:hypothetical protein
MLVLCFSVPALASIVNAVPIPAPKLFDVKLHNSSWISAITDTAEDVSKLETSSVTP